MTENQDKEEVKVEKPIKSAIVIENDELYNKLDVEKLKNQPREETDFDFDEDIRAEHSYEADEIAANPFLTRSLNKEPNPEGKNNKLFAHGCCKMNSYDWTNDITDPEKYNYRKVEVRFKNNRKEYLTLPSEGKFDVGDIVVTEAAVGFDIGIISMVGKLVELQIRKKNIPAEQLSRKVYRKARTADIEKWIAVVRREQSSFNRTREIAQDLQLDLKLNDVEFQGDGLKAVFYYTAAERVDFRELIKILAEQFHVRIEMKQIGIRQEASKLGGVGPCGRELCCSTWITEFQSVTTGMARIQQLSLNPQKLAGQCGKLQCCLAFEYDSYKEELATFPDTHIVLRTEKGNAIYHKSDVFARLMWYAYEDDPMKLYAIPVDKVREIIEKNEQNELPESLDVYAKTHEKKQEEEDVSSLELDDMRRFEKKKNNNGRRNNNQNNNSAAKNNNNTEGKDSSNRNAQATDGAKKKNNNKKGKRNNNNKNTSNENNQPQTSAK